MLLGHLEPADLASRTLVSAPLEIHSHAVVQLGRSPTSPHGITLQDPAVSALHCSLWGVRFDPESEPLCYVRDSSRNGTLLNGRRLPRGAACLLNSGDTLEVGMSGAHSAPFALRFRPVETPETPGKPQLPQCDLPPGWQLTSRVVGSGTFGHVLVCHRRGRGRSSSGKSHHPMAHAVKVVAVRPGHLDKEAAILAGLPPHPNIIAVHHAHFSRDHRLYLFQDLVAGGDLFSYLARGACLVALPEPEALVIVYQVLLALQFLHSHGIVHRDLKLDNVLLASPEPWTRVVLADFGIARRLAGPGQRMHTVVGTPEYCAPEVGFGRGHDRPRTREAYATFSRAATGAQVERYGYSCKCDLWSLGVLAHIVLTGVSPFYGDGSEKEIRERARRGEVDVRAGCWRGVSGGAREFVQRLLEVDEERRCDAGEALGLRWVRGHGRVLRGVYARLTRTGRAQRGQCEGVPGGVPGGVPMEMP